MPHVYLKTAANDALAAASKCIRHWLPSQCRPPIHDLQAAIPVSNHLVIFKGFGWTPAARSIYDKMIRAQRRSSRR